MFKTWIKRQLRKVISPCLHEDWQRVHLDIMYIKKELDTLKKSTMRNPK